MIPVQNIIKAYKSNSSQGKGRPNKLDINTDGKSGRENGSNNSKTSFENLLRQKLKP